MAARSPDGPSGARAAAGRPARLSVVVPALDEADSIGVLLRALRAQCAPGDEIIVVDGGSRDATAAIARPLADRVLEAPPGRARQMNAGAAIARGEWLWFVHADTGLPPGALATLRDRLGAGQRDWGRFDIRLSGRAPVYRLIEALINLRSRLSGIATGDQGIFVRRRRFEAMGGFPDQPLMEDLALCDRLRRHHRPLCLGTRLTTSSRRWEHNGVVRTVLLMWRLRWAYRRGADPAELARRYRGAPS